MAFPGPRWSAALRSWPGRAAPRLATEHDRQDCALRRVPGGAWLGPAAVLEGEHLQAALGGPRAEGAGRRVELARGAQLEARERGEAFGLGPRRAVVVDELG